MMRWATSILLHTYTHGLIGMIDCMLDILSPPAKHTHVLLTYANNIDINTHTHTACSVQDEAPSASTAHEAYRQQQKMSKARAEVRSVKLRGVTERISSHTGSALLQQEVQELIHAQVGAQRGNAALHCFHFASIRG